MKTVQLGKNITEAIADGQAVVALESTIISHGMPYPQNVETALQVEKCVRDNGAIPATIAIINGIPKAGLSTDEIELLGKGGGNISKVSRRDMPIMAARQQHGATTVAATMIIAAWAGIKVFATGGIGGVHRNAGTTFDVSADLQELANTDVAVVCAGAKSILDIGLTLEYLETYGVPVIGYQTAYFPAFYHRNSGFGVDYCMDSAKEIATMLYHKWLMQLKGGVVIGNAVPEAFEMPKNIIDEAIEKALAEADAQGIKGKKITPFLLSRIEQITGGNSLDTNIKLVLNNASLAAQIASEYSKIK